MKQLSETDVQGKYVVARVDFDDPLTPTGQLASDVRMRACLPTIEYLRTHGAKRIILVSKLGRPVMRPKERVELIQAGNPRLSLKPVALHLKTLLGLQPEKLGETFIENFPLPAYIIDKGLHLFENIRFDWREGANDDLFAADLASLGDLYVFDAFAMAHRAEASTVGVAKHIPIVAGFQLAKEIENLSKLNARIQHPFMLVLGGAKTETKLPLIERFFDRADLFLLGGVMANTFAKAQGINVKRSTVDDNQLEKANGFYKRDPSKFALPSDFVWQNEKTMDLGSKTRDMFKERLASAKTIFWNGTLGVTSLTAQEFKFASLDIARSIANNQSALTIVSGGDTIGFLDEQKVDFNQFTFVSTGGGATLEFLAGLKLPALEILDRDL
ncbi:phosphoglycerate kinase [Candidatus Berkelbacteria bacterium]|nr:phosphoglycerate kinase [Candidatus Berkelbacteria bacterium]